MKLFTNDEIRGIDRYTIDEEGIPARELIQRVAEGVAAEILARRRPSQPVTVFAGPGNNGADALAVARLLIEQGFDPEVFLFNIRGNSLSRECRVCRDELLATGRARLIEITDSMEHPELTERHLVVDGLFGSGLRDHLGSGYAMLVRDINDSGAEVVSIDIPSGLFADWNPNLIERNVVHASLTCAIQFPRLSFFMADNAAITGHVKVIDIGLSKAAIRATPSKYHLVEAGDLRRVLRERPLFASKADFGSALLVAGSYGMMGAALLAARGALRSGVGKLTVHSPRCGFNILQSGAPEALFHHDKNDVAVTDIMPQHDYNAVAVGPGIGVSDATIQAIDIFIRNYRQPSVLDADALNCLARRQPLLAMLTPGTVLTPHAAEFDRLFGPQPSAEARLLKAIDICRRQKIVIVLKGHYTATVRPDGKVFFNSSGNPGMATAGSGDVLTGIIASLMAQGYRSELAAVAGVFIHGLAGDIAAKRHGEWGLTSADIADCVGQAIKTIME